VALHQFDHLWPSPISIDFHHFRPGSNARAMSLTAVPVRWPELSGFSG
jgi:hypothetical protein